MWSRVAELQNAAVAMRKSGEEREALEYEAEIADLRALRVETRSRIDELRKK